MIEPCRIQSHLLLMQEKVHKAKTKQNKTTDQLTTQTQTAAGSELQSVMLTLKTCAR